MGDIEKRIWEAMEIKKYRLLEKDGIYQGEIRSYVSITDLCSLNHRNVFEDLDGFYRAERFELMNLKSFPLINDLDCEEKDRI